MPHLIVDYARTIEDVVEPEKLLSVCMEGADASGLFGPTDIKVRLVPFEHFAQNGGTLPFIHVMARILSGRSDDQKRVLSASILERLTGLELPQACLTVEIVDVHREVYAKQERR